MPTQHTVQQGDCISSIAAQYGLPWRKIWNDPANSALKQTRKDPNVLFPGDALTVPDKEIKEEGRPVDSRHVFKLKDPPTRIKIRLLLDDAPRANLHYDLVVDSRTIKGTTDGGGFLEAIIPPSAATGVLTVTDGPARDIFQLGFGTLDPIETEEGVLKRLGALGFLLEDGLEAAVRAFQAKQHLEVTGRVDDALRSKLKEKFGQ